MLYLMSHAQVHFRLQAEIDGVETPSIVSDAYLKQMPYLQAVVCEGLRIRPPVTGVVPKKVPKHGDMVSIDGTTYFLPGTKNVSHNAWGVHHSPSIFGEDAGVCRPERWLLKVTDQVGGAKLAAMWRTSGMIFGHGNYHRPIFKSRHLSISSSLPCLIPVVRSRLLLPSRLKPNTPYRASSYRTDILATMSCQTRLGGTFELSN
jgi:hypothetical protein